MTRPPLDQWINASADASFSAPQACAKRSAKFEKTIWRRNLLEYAAGAVIIAFSSAASVFAAAEGEWLIGLSKILLVSGVIVVLWNLYKRASNLTRRPEDACLTHLRRQYLHQAEALRAVPLWYVGPLVPGIMLFYAAIAINIAKADGWAVALEQLIIPGAVTVAVFAGVLLLNWIAARSLKRKIDALDALA